MFISKLNYRLKRFRVFIEHRFSRINIDWTDLLGKVVIFLIIIALGYNVFTAYNNGVTNLRRIEEEEQKLNKLLAEAEQLSAQVKYYESLDFKRIYAREILNLAEPDETLYYINRPEPEPQIEDIKDYQESIKLNDNAFWWKKLIFSI